jgi:hypothetical protein
MNVFANLVNKRNLSVNSKYAKVNPLFIFAIILLIVYFLLKERDFLGVNYNGDLQESPRKSAESCTQDAHDA